MWPWDMIYQNLPVIVEFVDLILERTDSLGPSLPKVVAIIQFTQSEEKSKGCCLNCDWIRGVVAGEESPNITFFLWLIKVD